MQSLWRILIIFCLLFNYTNSYANDTIIVQKDTRLDILSTKQAQINKRSSLLTSTGLVKGFRLQIISTNSRDAANKVKSDLLIQFPEHKSYLSFQSPYYKVRVGNFLKREDAEKLRKQLSKFYPQGVFVVQDAIEYTLKEDEEL